PTTAGERFEKRRPADVVENLLPVHGVGEVAKRFVVRIRRRLVRWQQHRARHGHTYFRGERVVKEFFVRAPPKRIVHHRRAAKRGVLEPSAVKRDILRDAIDDYFVSAWLALRDLVDLDELRHDLVTTGFLIHPLDKCRRGTVFLAKKDSDFL